MVSGYTGVHYAILSIFVYFEIFPNKKFQFQKEKKTPQILIEMVK